MSTEESHTDLQLVGNGVIDLTFLRSRLGVEASRAEFERLVEDIVQLKHPDVRAVRANPGDWGIDAFVGELTQGGSVMIWQAKYFIDDFDKSQKDEVTKSYKSALKAASEQGYTVDAWTLCIPRSLDGPELTWWTTWKRNHSKDGVFLDLMDEGNIRRSLMTPSAAHVRENYFSPVISVPKAGPAGPGEGRRHLQELVDETRFDNALFVHQMQIANLNETRSAREAFFNAEILTQEVNDKAVPAELASLTGWRIRVDSTWSNAFNSACKTTVTDDLPNLFQDVMDAIENRHHDEAAALRASVIHGIGIMHQRVENERAGWVRNWRDVAATHGTALSIASRSTPQRADTEHAHDERLRGGREGSDPSDLDALDELESAFYNNSPEAPSTTTVRDDDDA